MQAHWLYKTRQTFLHTKIRTKLILAFAPLIILPIMIISYLYYSTSTNLVSQSVKDSFYTLVTKNTELVDSRLRQIEARTQAMIIDEDLYRLLEGNAANNDSELLQNDRLINKIFYKYFPPSEDVYSLHLVTSYFSYGPNLVVIPKDGFYNSRLYQIAKDSMGKLRWVPTYYYPEMFEKKDLMGTKLDYNYLFSAVRVLNSSTLDGSLIRNLPPDIELPVLIINFKEEVFRNLFNHVVGVPGSYFLVTTEDGDIVSHNDSDKLGIRGQFPWLKEAKMKGSGSTIMMVDGKMMLICYDTSKVTGWVFASVVPMDNMVGNLWNVRVFTLYLGIFLTLLTVVLAILISGRVTKPIKQLIKGIHLMGEGKFASVEPVTRYDEIGLLINKFNNMEHKIETLIEENYVTKIREKEAEIMALNLQLNPHFLYNTLNTINWMAVDNDQMDISRMLVSLSTMLQYTVKTKSEKIVFSEDLHWLKSYAHIMENRFEGKFRMDYEIESGLLEQYVPKLFLQPFVENAILHGFENMEAGGCIRIIARLTEKGRLFIVEDNGHGIERVKLEQLLDPDSPTIGIQNVHRRVNLLYGSEYDLQIESDVDSGTIVVLTLPEDQGGFKK